MAVAVKVQQVSQKWKEQDDQQRPKSKDRFLVLQRRIRNEEHRWAEA